VICVDQVQPPVTVSALSLFIPSTKPNSTGDCQKPWRWQGPAFRRRCSGRCAMAFTPVSRWARHDTSSQSARAEVPDRPASAIALSIKCLVSRRSLPAEPSNKQAHTALEADGLEPPKLVHDAAGGPRPQTRRGSRVHGNARTCALRTRSRGAPLEPGGAPRPRRQAARSSPPPRPENVEITLPPHSSPTHTIVNHTGADFEPASRVWK
jgi:hypothetical protein